MVISLLAIAAGCVLILKRQAAAQRQGFRNVPVLGLFDRLASQPSFVALVGLAWILIGLWGLLAS